MIRIRLDGQRRPETTELQNISEPMNSQDGLGELQQKLRETIVLLARLYRSL